MPRPGALAAAVVAFCILAVVFLSPALLTGRVLLPTDNLFQYPPWRSYAADPALHPPHNALISDAVLQNYPWKLFARQALASGELPLWNPYILSGQPFLAAAQNAVLYPLGAVFYLLPVEHAYEWYTALHLVLAGIFTFAFLRTLGATFVAGMIAGVTYAFSGFLVVSILWPMVVGVVAWLPALLVAIERSIRCAERPWGTEEAGTLASRGPRWVSHMGWAVLGSVAAAMQFLAGHPEYSFYLVSTAGLFAAARLVLALVATRRVTGVALAGAMIGASLVLGAALAGPQLVPLAELGAQNFRVGRATYQEVVSYALPPRHLVAFLVPNFFGNPTHHSYFDLAEMRMRSVAHTFRDGAGHQGQQVTTEWGPKNYVEGTVYLGVLPLLLASAAVLIRRDRYTLVFAGIVLLSLLLMFGTPLLALFFFLVPGYSQLHTPFRWVFPYSFSVAVLAGLGAQALFGGAGRDARWGRYLGVASLVGGAAGAGGLVIAFVLRGHLIALADGLVASSADLARGFGEGRILFSYQFANFMILALLLMASGAVLLLHPGRAARWMALGLVVLDLFLFGISFNTAGDPAVLHMVPPSVRFVQADTDLFRVATFGDGDTFNANTTMLFGLQDIRGYDSTIVRDYADFMQLLEDYRGLLMFNRIDRISTQKALSSPLLDFLNVKYILSTANLSQPGLVPVYEGEVRIYRNEEVMPRAFLVGKARVEADRDTALRALADAAFDPRREVVLVGPAVPLDGEAPFTPALVESYRPGVVVVRASAEADSYLVMSDTFYPGWRASLDGHDVPVYQANGAFRAVYFPAGEHRVVFEFKPFSFRLGLLLSGLAAMALSVGAGVWTWHRLFRPRLGDGLPGVLARNALFPMVTSLVNKVLDLAFALVMMRTLGSEGVGSYTFAVVVVGYFDILVNFGLGTLVSREVARAREESDVYLWTSLFLRVVLWLASLPLVLLIALPGVAWLGMPAPVGLALALLMLGLLPSQAAGSATAIFQARERLDVPAAVTVLTSVMKVALGLVALMSGWGYVGLAAVSVMVNGVTAAVLWGLLAWMVGRPRLAWDRRLAAKMVVESWPLMLNNFLNNLFFRADAVLLGPLAGTAVLGWYSAAYRWIDGLLIVSPSVTLALFPRFSRYAVDSSQGLARAFSLSLKTLLLLAFPLAMGTALLAEPIMLLLAGPDFLPHSAYALQLLVWMLPFSFANGLIQYVLIALNRQRFITACFGLSATFNVGANLLLVPLLVGRLGPAGGYWAAAVVTVLTEIVLLVPFWRAVKGAMPNVSLLVLAWRPGVAAALMAAVVLAVRDWSWLLAVPVGAVVYGGALLALGGIGKEERAVLGL